MAVWVPVPNETLESESAFRINSKHAQRNEFLVMGRMKMQVTGQLCPEQLLPLQCIVLLVVTCWVDLGCEAEGLCLPPPTCFLGWVDQRQSYIT